MPTGVVLTSYDPHMVKKPPVRNGLDAVQDFYGEALDGDLLSRIEGSPDEHVIALRDHLEETVKAHHIQRMRQGQQHVGGLISETVSLADSVPLAGRERLDQLLLLAPSLSLRDPVFSWSRSLAANALLWTGFGEFDESDGDPRSALIATLHGMRPLLGLLTNGEIAFAAPEIHDSEPTRKAVEELMFRLQVQSGVSMKTVHRSHRRRGPKARSRVFRDHWANQSWDVLANELFADYKRSDRDRLLRRAIRLNDFAIRQKATVAATSDLVPFFSFAQQSAMGSITLPRMELSISDAVKIRSNEQVFGLFRSGLVETLNEVEISEGGEDVEAYAARLRESAQAHLSSTIEELERLVSAGKLWGAVAPHAAGLTVDLMIAIANSVLVPHGYPDLHLPGASGATKAATQRVVRNQTGTGEAAQTALRYATNLRLTGRL